jgi:hypothetical protein
MRWFRIAASLLCVVLSSNVLADWQVQYQEKDGSWRSSYTRKTEDSARAMADIECTRGKSPLRIVDTTSGKEHALHCDPPVRKITADGKPAPVVLLTEPEISSRAASLGRSCEGNAFMTAMLDCGCIEAQAKLEFAKSEARVSNDSVLQKLTRTASQECVDRKGTYDWAYTPCADIMKNSRPDDFQSFCACTAEATAAGFAKDPLINTAHYRRLNEAAMKQCGLGRKTR